MSCLDELEPITDKDLLVLIAKLYLSSPTSELVSLKILVYIEANLRKLGLRFTVQGKLMRSINRKMTSWGA